MILINTHVLYDATDMQFHMKRIMELRSSMIHGSFCPVYSINYFHGSSVMSMYPYIILYPIVLISFCIHSIILDYYIYFCIIIFATLIISFLSSLRYSKSMLISYIFSLTYSMSSLFVFKMFTDGDVGVTTSLIFLPLIIFGFIDLLQGSKNYAKLSLGLTLVLYCQIPSLLIMLLFIIFWILINSFNINRLILNKCLKSLILFMLLSSFVWIPIFHIVLFNKIQSVATQHLSGASLKFFLINLSILPIITLILGFINYHKFSKINKQMFLLSILVIILSSKLMPWKFLTSYKPFVLLNQFQFAYRFLIIPQIMLCYLFAVIVVKYINFFHDKRKLYYILIALIILLQIVSQGLVVYRKSNLNNYTFNNYKSVKVFSNSKINNKGCVFNNNKSMKYFIGGYLNNIDYYPSTSIRIKNFINNNDGISSNGIIKFHHIKFNTFNFRVSKNIKSLIVPILYYKNENVHLYINNHLISLHHNINKYNTFNLRNLKKGRYQIRIEPVFNICIFMFELILFFVGILWLILLLISYKFRKFYTNNLTKGSKNYD